MSSELAPPRTATPPAPPAAGSRRYRSRRPRASAMLLAHGEPMIWLTGGALATALFMIVGLVGLILWQGLGTFWPAKVVRIETLDGRSYAGEVDRWQKHQPSDQSLDDLSPDVAALARDNLEAEGASAGRTLLRTGNYDLTGTHYRWIDDCLIADETQPEWTLVVERLDWGRFYGEPSAFLLDGKEVATEPAEIWAMYNAEHDAARDRWRQSTKLAKHELGAVSRRKNAARLAVVKAKLDFGVDSTEHAAAVEEFAGVEKWEVGENARITKLIDELNAENARYQMRLSAADGQSKVLGLEEIVRAYPANQLGFFGKLGVYASRWWEYLSDEPREANSEGGVFPAIWGTVVMTLVMSLAVVPFGVLAALYLREYAHSGPIVSLLRIAINNLAGVPSIVFGVFGLGFFCYVVGANIDELFFSASLAENTPTFGTGGLMWASLTLALLTSPVVIVTTEEALAAVPGSMREGSYACGASKWQTIYRIVLPRALPGIMTGMILAMARGAGEVAPLMLVGAMKAAPELPLDGVFPYIHPERSFMHLGFHMYDLGFHSQNSDAARPMVFTTALLLISIIAVLNLTAVWLRMRLRKRFGASHV